MNTYAYVYRWTNKLTGQWYIGSRTARGCHPDDGYICSSRQIKPLILENQSDWDREIICIGEPDLMLKLESDLLVFLDAKNDPQSYNLHNGDGKFTTRGAIPWNKGKPGNKGQPAWNKGLTKETSASIAKLSASKLGKPAPNKGVPMSEEQKARISKSTKGRQSPKKGKPGKPQTAEANAKRSAALKGRTSPMKGRTYVMDDERKAKIAAAVKAARAKRKGA